MDEQCSNYDWRSVYSFFIENTKISEQLTFYDLFRIANLLLLCYHRVRFFGMDAMQFVKSCSHFLLLLLFGDTGHSQITTLTFKMA